MGLKERLVLPLARHWISGVEVGSAIQDAKDANSRDMGVVINFLGEEIKDPHTADSHAEEYLELQQKIADDGLKGFASVKLTQIGLAISREEASKRFARLSDNAEKLGQLLWIDMEGSRYTETTLTFYEEAHMAHQGVGVALQAHMRRSGSDLDAILDHGGKVRLVKGAYRESPDLVYTTREEVRENYSKLMKMLFEGGDGFAIATHDSVLIEEAQKLSGPSHSEFRFEMLKGIRDELKGELVKSGYKVYEYLPYGDRWWDYSKRRISEHPSNLWLLLRSFV